MKCKYCGAVFVLRKLKIPTKTNKQANKKDRKL